MWLEGGRLEQLDAALGAGRPTDIDRLLAEILAAGTTAGAIPSACSVCRRELVRTELRPGLVVSACPEQHGAWLNPDALGTLRRLLDAHAVSTRNQRRNPALAAGFAAAAVSLAGLAAMVGGPLVHELLKIAPLRGRDRRHGDGSIRRSTRSTEGGRGTCWRGWSASRSQSASSRPTTGS